MLNHFFVGHTELKPLISVDVGPQLLSLYSVPQVGHAVMTVAISACGPLWAFMRQRGTESHSFTARFVPLFVARMQILVYRVLKRYILDL